MRSTFKLLFYVNRQKIKTNGKCPIMGRITVDGKVCQYSTGEEVAPELWNAKQGRVNVTGIRGPQARELKAINTRLNEFEQLAKDTYTKNLQTINYVSAEIIKNALTGQAQPMETLLTLWDEHNAEYAKRVGVDRARHTYVRYMTARKHVYNFIRYKFAQEDVSLRCLDRKFIKDFQFYLSTVLKLKTISLNDYLILLRKIAKLAVKQRTLKRDPFFGHKLEIPPIKYRHLNGEQLDKVMRVELPTYRLCHTRDLFVFAVFTGLGRAELAGLTTDNLIRESDGSQWIYIKRQKTGAECRIKLLDIPLLIIQKYKGEGQGKNLFKVPQTCSLCRSLAMIKELCGLDCHLTFYMARHTFATETCLSNGVPIETISKMMGHSNIAITQRYAEVTNQLVRRDFTKHSEVTKGIFTVPDQGDMPPRVYQCGRYNGWKKEIKQTI